MTEALDPGAPRRPHPAGNGILARVPGQYIAQASKSLPDPACAIDEEISVEIDAARAGRVRLTFRKQRYSRPRGNIAYVSWLCRHAEQIAPSPQLLTNPHRIRRGRGVSSNADPAPASHERAIAAPDPASTGALPQADLDLATEGVLRYVWSSEWGDMLIEARDGAVYVNGQRVEAAPASKARS